MQSYRLTNETLPVLLERCGQRSGPDKWAIRQRGMCLNKLGEWEYEPIPSERKDDFIGRCRFSTPNEALSAWRVKVTA